MKQVDLSWGPNSGHDGSIATVREDGTVIGSGHQAERLRQSAERRMDMSLPPKERLLKFIGNPSYVMVKGPYDAVVVE
jgi:hypothetical protein